jgi:hypothetical protein
MGMCRVGSGTVFECGIATGGTGAIGKGAEQHCKAKVSRQGPKGLQPRVWGGGSVREHSGP